MEETYVIKIKRPENDYYEYRYGWGQYTTNVKQAFKYKSHDILHQNYLMSAMEYVQIVHPDWKIEKADYRNEIGTYISTYKPKATLKDILKNIGYILLIPILIPLVFIIDAKDKLKKIF